VRLSVAATAPFGADVLERLAARHDVLALLTRPDSRAGRGRKEAAPPARPSSTSPATRSSSPPTGC
jgi:methionyl-tRNA formyltransferase